MPSRGLNSFTRINSAEHVGGPIWKDHTFFFFSYEEPTTANPSKYNIKFTGSATNVFTADERNGVFPDLAASGIGVPLCEDQATYPAGTPYSTIFPTGHIPQTDISPIAKNLVSTYMPMPNLRIQFSWNPVATNKNNKFISRINT